MRTSSNGLSGDQTLDQAVGARERTAAVATAISSKLPAVSQDLTERLSTEIEELKGDEPILQLLYASIESNLDTILHILQHGIEVDRAHAPAAAVEYARRLAQRGVPVNALIRAYRLGQDSGLKWLLGELKSQEDNAHVVSAAALHIVSVTSAYIDRVTERVVTVYAEERDVWLLNRNAARTARVQELLEDKPVDIDSTENTLGYRLRRHHLGVVLWTEKSHDEDDQLANLERSAAALAEYLECRGRPLFVPCDELSAWAWLPVGSRESVDTAAISDDMRTWKRPVKLAIGTPADGIDGFCRTHRQALQAQAVAQTGQVSAPSATSFADVGPVALMCDDLDATRFWVEETLGSLAIDDEPHARLRETLHAFLASGCSYIAAAGQLGMHKNSVQYRLRKAEEERGRSLREDRLNLEMALTVCHWLGRAVLTPHGEQDRKEG